MGQTTCSQGLDSQGHGGGAYLGADQPPRINGLLKARVDGRLQQDALPRGGRERGREREGEREGEGWGERERERG